MSSKNTDNGTEAVKDVAADGAKGAGRRKRSAGKDAKKGRGARVAGRALAFVLRAATAVVALVCIEIAFANVATSIVYSLIEKGSLAGLDGLNMFSAFCGAGSFAACAAAVGCWKGVGRLADRVAAKVSGADVEGDAE